VNLKFIHVQLKYHIFFLMHWSFSGHAIDTSLIRIMFCKEIDVSM
jgi:hypothetical protein